MCLKRATLICNLLGGDCRRSRNGTGLSLANNQTAEVAAVWDGTVTFRVEGWRMLDLHAGDAQLLHVDLAWASTVHAFQGRTVDTADGCGRDAELGSDLRTATTPPA